MNALFALLFAAAGGWHVGADRVHACPGTPAARCVMVGVRAATVPWRDCDECLPIRTIGELPPDGIALEVLLSREHPVVAKSTLVWPPRIHLSDLSGIEGVPTHYGVYQRFARVGNGEEAYVWAFFGRAQPTAAQLARANAELATMRIR